METKEKNDNSCLVAPDLQETWVENDAEEVRHGAETQRQDQSGMVQTDDMMAQAVVETNGDPQPSALVVVVVVAIEWRRLVYQDDEKEVVGMLNDEEPGEARSELEKTVDETKKCQQDSDAEDGKNEAAAMEHYWQQIQKVEEAQALVVAVSVFYSGLVAASQQLALAIQYRLDEKTYELERLALAGQIDETVEVVERLEARLWEPRRAELLMQNA